MFDAPGSELIPMLQAALAPVTVISGAALLLSSMTARYARTSERIRAISRQYDEKLLEGKFKQALVQEISILFRRQRLIRVEIVCVATSILCVALTIFCLFTHLAFAEQKLLVVNLAKIFFMTSILLLLVSMTFFIFDMLESLKALHANIEPHPELTKVTRRKHLL